jgi:hypothetical protein
MNQNTSGTPGALNEGYRPKPAARVPDKVKGGYKPSTSQHGPPPTGGSAVKPKA